MSLRENFSPWNFLAIGYIVAIKCDNIYGLFTVFHSGNFKIWCEWTTSNSKGSYPACINIVRMQREKGKLLELSRWIGGMVRPKSSSPILSDFYHIKHNHPIDVDSRRWLPYDVDGGGSWRWGRSLLGRSNRSCRSIKEAGNTLRYQKNIREKCQRNWMSEKDIHT